MATESEPTTYVPELAPLDVSDDELRAAVEAGNLPLLLLVVSLLTGEEKWLADPFRPTRALALDDNDDGGG